MNAPTYALGGTQGKKRKIESQLVTSHQTITPTRLELSSDPDESKSELRSLVEARTGLQPSGMEIREVSNSVGAGKQVAKVCFADAQQAQTAFRLLKPTSKSNSFGVFYAKSRNFSEVVGNSIGTLC